MTAHPDAATWRKLGVRDGDALALWSAPTSWSTANAGAVTVRRRRGHGPSDVVVAFVASAATLASLAAALADAIATDGRAWVAWPRREGGHRSDLTDHVVRAAMLAQGLVDVKVARLDDDWSGLMFVRRAQDRTATR